MSPPVREGGRVFAAARSVAGWTMASRLLGFARDMVMATALGAGLAADAFFLAWMIPNLFRRLFGEGAFAAALVPVFIEARERDDRDGALRLVNAATTRLAAGLSLLVGLLVAACALLRSDPGLALLTGPLGLAGEGLARVELVLELSQLLLPYLVLICLAGVLGGALNALDRFTVPAAAPIVLNLVWLAALVAGWWLVDGVHGQVRLLALALVGAGVVQLAMHLRAMGQAGQPYRPVWQTEPERLKRVRALFWSLALGLALFQLNALSDSLIAYAFVPTGGVSALYYANRLVQLPTGVLGTALATVVFPELSRRAKRGDHAGVGALLDRGVALGAFVAIPAAVGLAALAGPLVEVLFRRGEFDQEAADRTARVLLLLAPAVVAACVSPVITRSFYAEEQVRLPVRVSVACVLLNVVLNLILVFPLQEAGLALSTSISQLANLGALAWLSGRQRRARGAPPASRANLLAVLRFGLYAGVMAAATLAAHRLLPGPDWLRLLVAIGVGVTTYGGLAWVTRTPELRALTSRGRPEART